ncbi:phosphate transport system regulatory protein PhoU [Endozoicomonas sp. (ex Bugula neritina AB1)]|nr:phosphate transport system regulatory protein PhoU [Endozoicomonas sp. (ex Bugula neritina AB1)]
MDIKSDLLNGHISQQFNAELEDLRNSLLAMGGLVELQVSEAIEALINADSDQASSVCEKDTDVNFMEVSIDQECSRILARRQPAATDLRLVMACTKAATDLERIGDEAAKIARFAIKLSEQGESPRGYIETRHIGNHVRQMVRDALDAFARFDAEQALNVAKEDKSVDREYKSATRELVTYMMEDPRSITRVLNIMWVLRSLERIGDHARNIAEYVIYLVKGTDVRHIGLKRMQDKVFED